MKGVLLGWAVIDPAGGASPHPRPPFLNYPLPPPHNTPPPPVKGCVERSPGKINYSPSKGSNYKKGGSVGGEAPSTRPIPMDLTYIKEGRGKQINHPAPIFWSVLCKQLTPLCTIHACRWSRCVRCGARWRQRSFACAAEELVSVVGLLRHAT